MLALDAVRPGDDGWDLEVVRSFRRFRVSVGRGVRYDSGDNKRSFDASTLLDILSFAKAYGDAVRFVNSGTPFLMSSKFMLSFEGRREALRAFSSSLVGGVGTPDALGRWSEFPETDI